jgi:hypothetical protein
MAIRIEPYAANHVAAAAAFNARLDAGQVEPGFRLELSPEPDWLAPSNSSLPYQEFFLAVDGEAVRGGYALKHQSFQVGGSEEIIGFYRAPVSEGLVDKRFAVTGVLLLRDALARRPMQFALGMGNPERPLPRMLRGMGWKFEPVPFLFRLSKPHRVLRHLRAVRTTPLRRLALDAAAWSGAATTGCLLLQGRPARVVFEEPEAFSAAEVDSLWTQAREEYSFCAVRTASVLNRLYPARDKRFLRLTVRKNGALTGWAVLMDTAMRDDKYFGDLRVGSLIDCLALPGQEAAVAAAATRLLEGRGVDLVIANMAHDAWIAGLHQSGWRKGPTNFFLAVSPKLAERLQPWETIGPRIHLLRGDGDGPIHL